MDAKYSSLKHDLYCMEIEEKTEYLVDLYGADQVLDHILTFLTVTGENESFVEDALDNMIEYALRSGDTDE